MKIKYALTVILLGLVLVLLVGSAAAKPPVTVNNQVIWELKKAVIVSTGTTQDTPEGVFIQGVVVEAMAKTKSGKTIPEGTFRLSFDLFRPNMDMPGQKAGFWYVVGSWTISKKDAAPESLKARHSPDIVQGSIKAELTFNPLESPGNWSALASLPMSPAAERWSRGKGSLSLNAAFTGDLYLDLEVWPEIR